MDTFDIAFYWFLVLLGGFGLAQGLGTGAIGFGAAAARRGDDPARYWFKLGCAFVLVLFGLWFLSRAAHGRADELDGANPLMLLFAGHAVFALIRGLRRGRIAVADASFDRAEEPLQFWLLVAAHAGAAAALAWLSLPHDWD